MSSTSPESDPAEKYQDDFDCLYQLARAGDADACERLYRQYAHHVLAVVRRHLRQPLRKICDSVDVAQSVWRTVFEDVLDGQDFEGSAHFLHFLEGLTRNKVLKVQHRHVGTQKRSLSREQSLNSDEYAGRELDPADQVAAEDELAVLLRSLSERDRSILFALRDGDRLDEAAGKFGISVKTIRRLLERCRVNRSMGRDMTASAD